MPSQSRRSRDIPLLPLPTLLSSEAAVDGSSRPHFKSMSSDIVDNVPADAYSSTIQSRRSSVASSASTASSQARNQEGRPLKKVFENITVLVRTLDSTATHRLKRSRYHGWRMGVLFGSCMSAFVLCCNIAIAIVGGVLRSHDQDGIADLMYGNATYIDRWSTVFHLLINAGSTILLAASNYTMQVLCSPTRHDIDVAHAKGKWLDIGLLSFRNLGAIPWTRAVLWLLLALSSIPLHLFYNSAVFQVVTFNKYNIITIDIASDTYKELNSTSNTYWNLSNAYWEQTYDKQYVSEHGDLYLAIDRIAFSMSEQPLTLTTSEYCPLEIPDGNQTIIRNITFESPDWIRYDIFIQYSVTNETNGTWPVSAHVAHGFASIVRPQSRIQISLFFMIVVIVFNAFKLAIMVWVLVTDKSQYIVTLGDAAASFLELPDLMTSRQCMLGKEEILSQLGHVPLHTRQDDPPIQEQLLRRVAGTWLPQTQRYFHFVPRDRKVIFMFLLGAILTANIVIPLLGDNTKMHVWGTLSEEILPFRFGTLLNAWFVNLPQILLSFCYLTLNGICTSIASTKEWDNMAGTRKGLRVTQPKGNQRSTHFLQLPYRWAMPLLVTSGILHWLMSQSFFLVRLDVINQDNTIDSESSKSACGFSRLSLLIFFIISLVLVSGVGFAGLRTLKQRLPFAASCSLVISAACHPRNDEVSPHLSEVRWGVVDEQAEEGYGHCSLTTTHIGKRKPVKGRIYR